MSNTIGELKVSAVVSSLRESADRFESEVGRLYRKKQYSQGDSAACAAGVLNSLASALMAGAE